MSGSERRGGPARCEDVRLRGFSARVSVEEAIAWIDAHAERLAAEIVTPAEAPGRILAAPVQAVADLPPGDRAAEDGYALRSRETLGAGAYNPLPFPLQAASAPLGPGAAALVAAGWALPPGADAVLPFAAVHVEDDVLEVHAPLAEGMGVAHRGEELRSGAALLERGRAIRPQDAGLLASLGVERVSVIRRPRVRLVVAGPKRAGAAVVPDADGPMLHALVARDGGAIDVVLGADGRAAIGAALAAPGADAILVAGRTGTGPDDDAPLALADVGELALHGVALRPGGSTGLGRVEAIPVVLLPGEPLACLGAYELFAGRLIRLLGGRDPAPPQPIREAEVGRKIVSAVGFVDLCRVRLVDGRAEPVGSAEHGGLASAVRGDGFVLVPAPLEGYAPGTRVRVHLDGAAPVGDANTGAAR